MSCFEVDLNLSPCLRPEGTGRAEEGLEDTPQRSQLAPPIPHSPTPRARLLGKLSAAGHPFGNIFVRRWLETLCVAPSLLLKIYCDKITARKRSDSADEKKKRAAEVCVCVFTLQWLLLTGRLFPA